MRRLRDELLRAHYGHDSVEKNLYKFKKDFHINDPSPDQVWQELIRHASKLKHYTLKLYDLFNPLKPIPPTYYMLARWYFIENAAVCGFATTNFDLQLAQAFRKIATALNKRIDKDYCFASVPQDFSYLSSAKTASAKVIQQLHGSLERPWSIVAGAKGNINALSNLLFEDADSTEVKPWVLIRRFVNIMAPLEDQDDEPAPVTFAPYEYAKASMSKANRIIFIGYSFQDKELVSCITSKIAEGAEIILIDPHPNIKRLKSLIPNADYCRVTGETFLREYITGLKSKHCLIMLPQDERHLLREGPQYIHNYPRRRILTAPHGGETSDFLDPIYGVIDFSSSIKTSLIQVVDTGELQRLRQIKQLSFVHLKYHAATHDRFSHSLGVAHLADKAFESILRKQRHLIDRDVHLEFVVASLIHDIGHGPYGHTMDLVRRELGHTDGHEDDTEKIYAQIHNALHSFADLDLALDTTPVRRDALDSILAGRNMFGHILSNPGCDIDRLDFVMRDASATLVSLAGRSTQDSADLNTVVVNHQKLLDSMCICRQGKIDVLCYELRVLDVLEAFARLYCKLYQNVYYCWQNTSARLMLSHAVVLMLNSKRVEYEDIKPLTDIELLAALEESENPTVREYAHLVKYRRLFPLVKDIPLNEEAEIKHLFSNRNNREIVSDLGHMKYHDDMLVARLPSKSVVCTFIEESDGTGSEELITSKIGKPVELGKTAARLMIFRPPG